MSLVFYYCLLPCLERRGENISITVDDGVIVRCYHFHIYPLVRAYSYLKGQCHEQS